MTVGFNRSNLEVCFTLPHQLHLKTGTLIDKGLNWCCVIFFLAPGVLMEWLAVTLVYANSSFAIRAE